MRRREHEEEEEGVIQLDQLALSLVGEEYLNFEIFSWVFFWRTKMTIGGGCADG